MKSKDITGVEHGFWKVLKQNGKCKDGQAAWLCRCVCGFEKNFPGSEIRAGRAGQSCGCKKAKSVKQNEIYSVWLNMNDRCNNPNGAAYKNYGGRGISVCQEWKSFHQFSKDMGERPKGTTLERKENDGMYCKGNCVWATRAEQSRNNRRNIVIEWRGETHVLADWAIILGFKYRVLRG